MQWCKPKVFWIMCIEKLFKKASVWKPWRETFFLVLLLSFKIYAFIKYKNPFFTKSFCQALVGLNDQNAKKIICDEKQTFMTSAAYIWAYLFLDFTYFFTEFLRFIVSFWLAFSNFELLLVVLNFCRFFLILPPILITYRLFLSVTDPFSWLFAYSSAIPATFAASSYFFYALSALPFVFIFYRLFLAFITHFSLLWHFKSQLFIICWSIN